MSGASLATAALAVGPAPMVAAQASEPPGFVPGEATAAANTVVLGLSPGGGKPIEIALGKATARFQNRTATAEGSALALGLLQIFFGPTSQCGDRPPIIPADQLPPVTTNDSRKNQPMVAPLEVHSPGWSGTASVPGSAGGVIGTQIANAQSTPQASASGTTTISQDYGVLAIDGGRTEVSTKLDGGVREAIATTTATRLRVMGDMVVINEPRWTATARSGGVETAEGSFSFTSATIFGIEQPAANFPGAFNDFAAGIANFLGGLGVSLSYPKLETEPGKVTMTPLTLTLANPPIGLDFIKPLLKQLEPLKEENTRNLIAEDCNNQAILQVADLSLGILGGTGSLAVSIGGVSAFTAATEFPEPQVIDLAVPDLGAALDAPLVVPPPQVLGQDLSSSRSTSSPSFDTPSTDIAAVIEPIAPIEAVVDTPAPTVAAAVEPSFELPDATLVSRRFEPGSKGGTAALVGAGGVLALLLLAAADRFVMKRNKRVMSP